MECSARVVVASKRGEHESQTTHAFHHVNSLTGDMGNDP